MGEKKMPHPMHDQHLCYLENIGYVKSSLEEYKELVRSSNYVCQKCGRTAADEKNLCSPEKL